MLKRVMLYFFYIYISLEYLGLIGKDLTSLAKSSWMANSIYQRLMEFLYQEPGIVTTYVDILLKALFNSCKNCCHFSYKYKPPMFKGGTIIEHHLY